MTCPACGSANPSGAKFCVECGARLALVCSTCGHSASPSAKFCPECGTPFAAGRPASPTGAPPATIAAGEAPRTAERRVVSVLFADLVGFTTLSEDRDPEQVRDLLSRYFEAAREIIGRYGGTVEKFIGDAVMAVWGAPIAHEDDAERAVRAGLDLVEAIPQLGPGLQLRAGVLTGEVAVTIGAEGQGMVAGDLVNTASRLESVAPPGTVLVGETTHRAASGSIVFEPAGEQLLKGKSAPVPAYRALRVVAKRGGQGRSEALEAPFVGRDAEIRLLRELFHATGRERRARLVSVVGQAGIGKSRLVWEFHKYIDGLSEDVFWHQGRSPAYGEGVAFWALGEMVRKRAGLLETDDEAATRAGIASALVEYVADPDERRWIEPALLVLLGVREAPPGGRDALFAAWRTFLERVSLQGPVALVFEDLQWADAGLLDFIEHLLEWSADYPIYVVTLARPELLERRLTWGAGHRSVTSLSLGPLDESAMRQLLSGLVPGLPEPAAATILERAGGIPLYAVETVRMLVAEGRLEPGESGYRPVGDLTDLAVPDTLSALISARLDALEPSDRSLLQDGSVLGQTFTIESLGAVSGRPVDELQGRLRALVRREMLVLDTDPRSPERGQYGFVQALVREVAYGTLSRRDRRARHLAAARYFESLGDDEIAGALATHYLDAYRAAPEGAEGEAVAVQARLALRGAGERAAALGSHDQALAYFRRALEVTTAPSERADMLERAGVAATAMARYDEAESLLRTALELWEGTGDRRGLARATAALGTVLLDGRRIDAAFELLGEAVDAFADLADEAALPAIMGQIARAHAFRDEAEAAVSWADRALAAAERLDLVPIIADTLITKASALSDLGRGREAIGLYEAANNLATSSTLPRVSSRALINLSAVLVNLDPRAAVEAARRGLALSRRYGIKGSDVYLAGNGAEAAIRTGEWDWAEAELRAAIDPDLDRIDRMIVLEGRCVIDGVRGRPVADELAELRGLAGDSSDPFVVSLTAIAETWLALAGDDPVRARAAALRAARSSSINGPSFFGLAARAALWNRDHLGAIEALDAFDALRRHGPIIAATRSAIAAGLFALEGRRAEAITAYREARAQCRDAGLDFEVALIGLEMLRLLGPGDPEVDTAAAEAAAICRRLQAEPFLAQLERYGLVAAPAASPESRSA